MLMKARINKFLILFTVLLFCFGQMWADSETVPKTTDNWTGTSCSLTHAECANGSANAKKDGDASDVTYIKFRTNKNGNTMTFEVNEGYKVTGFSIRGYANDNSKAVELASVKYDSADPIAVSESFPNKNAGTTYTYSNTSDEATSAIVLSFGTNAGTQIMAVITITYEETGSGGGCTTPTDPAISGTIAYTEGENISLTASATGAASATFTWYKGADWATASAGSSVGTGATLSINSCATTDAGTYWCNISNGTGCEVQVSKAITVSAAAAVCPSGISISGTAAYTAGETIELTAALTEGNGTISYQWYKGSIAAGNEVGTNSNVLTIASCATSDAGDYFCVASKTSCSDATSSAYAVTVAAVSYCAELYPATSGASPTQKNEELLLQTEAPNASYGGKIYTAGAKDNNWSASFTYGTNGLSLNKGGADSARVELNHLMKVGTVITATLVNPDASKARGYKLLNTNKVVKATWQATTTDPQTYTYTVVANDGLAGTNKFLLNRAESSALKELKVSNCGAELFALSSAIYPAEAAGKATITLSKNLVETGGTATAEYSAIDAAWDFDEWVISGTDASISSASANPVTITMGSEAATITLKLKAAGTKHTVTYYDENDNKLGEELVVEGEHPVGLSIAPRKLGYTFAGWGTSKAGPVVAFTDITVNADMPLYTIWNEIDCSAQFGTIYTMSIAVAPAANCTIKTASGYESTWDLYQYEGVSGGEAIIGNTGSSNNCILTTDKTVILKDNVSYMKLDFDCALAKDDKIQSSVSGNTVWVSTDATRPSGASTALAVLANSATGEFVVPAASGLIGAQTIYLWKGGGNATITSVNIVRPTKHTVSFNMNGHGDAIDPQYVVDGGKATEPTAPTADGYRFVEWQLSGSAYDFDDAVTSDITLDAVWQKTWTVTFDSDGGSAVAAATVDAGAAVAQPADPTKDGFDFVEWRKEGESVAYDFATAVTANITLVAQWEVAQDDASLSALSYNSNAIDVSSAVDISGVQTYTVHLQYGSSIDPALISVTQSAPTATLSAIVYDSENKRASFSVESGNHLVTINYVIQFVIDAKRGTSIIKAVTANNTVTGLIGGTRNTNLSNGASKKLDKQTYFGMTLANDETFQEGDVIIINITAPADLGKFMVYADAERTELVADQGIVYTKPEAAVPVLCPTGEMMMTLPAEANGKTSLYLSRENGNTQWNVTFSSLEVTREMAPVIKSFKFGDDAATINESAKTITIEVPFSTDVTALTPAVEVYGNNGATYTPSGAQDFTSSVDYTVTDAYGESTTYEVTVTKAAASTNANLASLAVTGYSLDFDPDVVTYNVVLDYGTTVLPTITYVVEEVGLATAAKVEDGVNGATTITVTPEAGAGYEKVYTINFSVNTSPKYVIYDGSLMTNIPSATGSDASTGFSYSLASNIALSGDAISGSWGGKDYTHVIKGFKPTDNTNNIVSFVIPDGYLAKVRLVGTTNSTGTERKMFIAKNASKNVADAIGNYIITSSTYDAQGFVTGFLMPNTYYLGSTDAMRLFEFSIQLYPIDYTRDVTQGRYGTICLPNGGIMVGAELYEVAYYGETSQKIFFDQIVNGVMEAGVPYVFLPKEGVSALAVTYTDAVNAPAGDRNGLYGSYTREELPSDGSCYILLNNQYCQVLSAENYVGANKAYFKLEDITPTAPALAPGRIRMSIGAAAPQVATGIDQITNDQLQMTDKVIINGQLFILRGEKLYDATGRLVK